MFRHKRSWSLHCHLNQSLWGRSSKVTDFVMINISLNGFQSSYIVMNESQKLFFLLFIFSFAKIELGNSYLNCAINNLLWKVKSDIMCLNFLQCNLNKTFNSHPLENKLHRGNPCANTSDWIEDWNSDLMPFTSRKWQYCDTTFEIRERFW